MCAGTGPGPDSGEREPPAASCPQTALKRTYHPNREPPGWALPIEISHEFALALKAVCQSQKPILSS